MTEKMLKFVKIGQQTPPKREVANRREDFNEIYDDFVKQKAEEQQGRLNGFGKRLGGPLAVSCLWVLHGLGLCWRRNKYPEVSDIQTREETILSGTGFRSDTVRLRCRPGSPA